MDIPFLDQPLGAFLDLVASDEPAPGAGAAAATAAALAAGLVGMAARLSAAQLPDGADRAARADAERGHITALAQSDAEAYRSVLAAWRLPREPEPQHRRAEIRRCLTHAAQVPLEIAESGARIAAEAVELAERGNPKLRGDVLAAVFLAGAAARSAAELVRLNVELG
ncbi:MAG: cyclodeaminase/cyclohydrolase family protein, partial [Pseudonocardiaceae bacterium]